MVSIQSLKPGSGAGVGSSVSFVASAPTLANPVYSVRDSFNGTSTVATSNINSAGLFTWTPSIADLGLHSLAVTATDVLGNAASSTTMISITTASATVETPVPIPTPLPVPMTSTTTASSPAITAVATKKYLFTANLAIGSRGTAVLELQKRLTALGFYTGPITGYYGSLTSASVKQFQGANSISRLGIVGPATRAALNK
jgi:hypothetical protein